MACEENGEETVFSPYMVLHIVGRCGSVVRMQDWRPRGPGFETLAIPFTPLCQCRSEERQKAVGPLYLVSMPA